MYPPHLKPPNQIHADFRTIAPVVDEFIRSLSRISKNETADGTLPPPFVAELKATMTPTVLLSDKTDAATFYNEGPLDAQHLGSVLTSKGYLRFGCYAQVTDKFGLNLDGAVVMFLMFHTSKDARSTSYDTALGVRPFFHEGLISSLTITDNDEWIGATLDAKHWHCRHLDVRKPSEARANTRVH